MIDAVTSQRLANIAARLAPDHDGEVLTAARLLVRGLADHGMTITDLFESRETYDVRERYPARSSTRDGDCVGLPPHVPKIDELLGPRWGMLRSHRTEKLLTSMRLMTTITADEQKWLDALYARMVRLRSKAVSNAWVNMPQDYKT